MKVLLRYLGMDRKNFGIFLVITFSTCIYWFSSIKSVIYEPFRSALGVSNTQLGFLLGLIGFVQIFGYLLLGWLQDLLPIRKLIAFDLVGYGSFALVLGLVPHLPYWFLVFAFAAFGFFGDAVYWPTIQKSVKGVASKNAQAAAFSTQEAIRGAVNLLLNTVTLGLFIVGGSNIFGARLSMIAYPIFMILFSLVVLKCIPKDFLHEESEAEQAKKTSKKDPGLPFKMVFRALRIPIIWTTGVSAACTYLVFVATNTYFLPFVQSSFHLSAGQAGVFGIVNSGVVSLIAAIVSGLFASLSFKSSPQWMMVLFCMIAALSVSVIYVPRTSSNVIPVIAMVCLITFACIALRAVYYAPVGEYGVDSDISATAMSIASFIGYCPSFFAYPLFGWIIDSYETNKAYQIIFILLAVASIFGVVSSYIGHRLITGKRNATPHAAVA